MITTSKTSRHSRDRHRLDFSYRSTSWSGQYTLFIIQSWTWVVRVPLRLTVYLLLFLCTWRNFSIRRRASARVWNPRWTHRFEVCLSWQRTTPCGRMVSFTSVSSGVFCWDWHAQTADLVPLISSLLVLRPYSLLNSSQDRGLIKMNRLYVVEYVCRK